MRAVPDHAWQPGMGILDPDCYEIPLLTQLADIVRRTPEAVAVIDAAGQIRFGDLWNRALVFAAGLLAADTRAVAQAEPVGVLVPAGIPYVVAMLGCLAAGRIAVPLDAAAPEARQHEILVNAGARLIVGAPGSITLPPGCAWFDPAETWGGPTVAPRELPVTAPAFVFATSGSAGAPKLIVHNQRNLAFLALGGASLFGIGPSDRVMFSGAVNSHAALQFTLTPLLAGAALVMVDMRTAGLGGLIATMARAQATVLRIFPSLVRVLLGLPGAAAAFAHLRLVRMIGEAILVRDIEMLRPLLPPGTAIVTSYSATETVGFDLFVPDVIPDEGGRVPSGTLRAGAAFALVDDDNQPVHSGEPGQVLIRSRYNAHGEWLDGRCVPGRLPRLPNDPETSIYRTGDLARVNEAGLLVVLGRADQQVKINGNRVELTEIEQALRAAPDVVAAAALVKPGVVPARIAAFVVPVPGQEVGIEARLRAHLKARLPLYMVPSRFIVLDALPHLPGGKLNMPALQAMI